MRVLLFVDFPLPICYHILIMGIYGNMYGGHRMKDFIVLIATVVLGVIIAGLILSLRGTAEGIRDKAVEEIENVFSVTEVTGI